MIEPMSEPNPGSEEARAQGCTCAVLDNNHGKFPPWPPDGWWITEGCPVHAPKKSEPNAPAVTERDAPG